MRQLGQFYRDEIYPRLTPELFESRGAVWKKRRGHDWRTPCPLHGGRDPNMSVNPRSLRWYCFSSCQRGGDPIDFVMAADGIAWKDAVSELARDAGLCLDLTLGPPRRSSPARKLRGAITPATSGKRPSVGLLRSLVAHSRPAHEDPAGAGWLRSRLGSDLASRQGLVRILRTDMVWPPECTFRGRAWGALGIRLIVDLYDERGIRRSLRGRNVDPACNPEEKAAALACGPGSSAGLVMANGPGREMLVHGGQGERILVCEGEPDFLQQGARLSSPVLGIISGSWTQAFGDRISDGTQVYVATHHDEAGQKYFKKIVDTLAGRCQVFRARPPL